MSETKVLGIDLASRSWRDNGSSLLTFEATGLANWKSATTGCVSWPEVELSPQAMADAIIQFVIENEVAAVSLDGPQGWRDPNASPRPGVGRFCEYETKCQGKTGEFGRTYPQTQHGWISFCIDVFKHLRVSGRATIVNDPDIGNVPRPEVGKFWLLESFPTSTWRTSDLAPLPGKSRIGRRLDEVKRYSADLAERYAMPSKFLGSGTHDDLQATVAALPAAGLLGGPCRAIARGLPTMRIDRDGSELFVEGLIWDSQPLEVGSRGPALLTNDGPAISVVSNPILVDDRDDAGPELLNQGVRLFRNLATRANVGEAVGVGYAQFVALVHGVEDFNQVANRKWAQSDTAHVLQLAAQVTEEAGGRISVTQDDVEIMAGMDTFIWSSKPPYRRNDAAFATTPYSQEQWLAIFPNGRRQLIHRSSTTSFGAA